MAKPRADPVAVFSKNLFEVRRRRGYSQENLASMSGIHASEISRLEKGVRDPRLTTMVKLADGLGVPVDLLINPEPLPARQ